MELYFDAFITNTILREFQLRARELRWVDRKPATKSQLQSYVRDVIYRNMSTGVVRPD